MTDDTLKPADIDWRQAARFLDLLGKNGDARLRAFPHKETPDEARQRLGARKFGRAKAEIERAQRDGLGIYAVINHGGDTKDSIVSCPAYFAEFDGLSEDEQITRWEDSGLPEPSMVVRTGGESLHFYWLLDQPFTDPGQWQLDQKRLAVHLGSDPSIHDPSRVMRVPGCSYMGPDQQPIARVVIIHESEARYSRDEIVACLPPESVAAPLLAPAQTALAASPAAVTGGLRVALKEFITKAHGELIQHGSAKGCNNDDGMALALDLVGTEEWLLAKGVTPDPSARELYEAYVDRSATNYGRGFDRKAAWARFEGAPAKTTGPSTPEHKLEERLAYHRRQQGAKGTGLVGRWPLVGVAASVGDIQLAGIEGGAPSVASALDALLGPAEEGKLRRPRTDRLTRALSLILPLKYNLLTGRIERDGQVIHGDYLGGLYLELAEEHQLDVTKDRAIDAAMRVARKNSYHPVRDYLSSITTRLSPEDWAAIDVHCFGREDHTGMAGLHLQRQLIGLVARAMTPGCEFQTALVLHSDRQGVGKSSYWRILGGEWFSDSLGDLRNLKDDLLQLHSAWIHEWGEIDMVMGKQESEALKRFLSASRDDVRKPYGRGVESLQRSCGIVGTTNRRDFIKDPTGNRRFPIISIEKVNLDWVVANRDAIWGSALVDYRKCRRWHYDNNENALVSANALAFAPEDPLRERIETWAEDHPAIDEVPLVQILKVLQLDTDDQSIRSKAGNALTSLGWTRTKKKGRYDLPWGERTNSTWGWRRPA